LRTRANAGLFNDRETVTDPIELTTVWRAKLRVAAVGGLSVC
jgi:hypothetical protein